MYESINVGVKLPKKLIEKIDEEANEMQLDRSTVIRQAVARQASEYAFEKAYRAFSTGEASLSKAAHEAGMPLRQFANKASQKGYRYYQDAAQTKMLARQIEKIIS